jgi:diacylglycerol diphosphate phosphatase/phosphatidate phosphatase
MRASLLWVSYCAFLAALCLAVFSGDVYNSLAHNRPVPGQRISVGGTTVFVRDPSHDHAIRPSTVPTSWLWQLVVLGGVLNIALEMPHLESMLNALAMTLMGTILTELLTSVGKSYMGFLRPNFYAGCGWSDELMACSKSVDEQYEFRKSFPSGHSSHSACFAALLTLHLLRHASLALGKGTAARTRMLQVLALVPGPIALFVAASRVHDNWHHPADIVAGLGLGTGCGALAHRLSWGYVSGPRLALGGGVERDPLV